jgi:F-type H+-transporting ATPase subunit delta
MSNGEAQAQVTADVGAQRVARTYAEALFNAANKSGQGQTIYDELGSLVRDVLLVDPHVEEVLASPAVPTRVKAAAIDSTFGPRSSELFTNFLRVLNDHGRLDLLLAIALAFRELADQQAKRVRVQVHSAAPLQDDQRDRLRQELRDGFHLEPILEERVDPDLLGGLVVRVGDWQYDGSVRTQLRTIRNYLIERSSHEIQSGRDRFGAGEGAG